MIAATLCRSRHFACSQGAATFSGLIDEQLFC